MAHLTSILLSILTLLSLGLAITIPSTDYEVAIVGGGPAGLSVMSALCRVGRRAVLYDTAEYRNNATRNMHDVIGADGAVPTEFRAKAREMIDKYHLGTFKKHKVIEIKPVTERGYQFFRVIDSEGYSTTARRVVLATGVSDVLPDTEGVMDAYGKGMYWCPWCDGFEHREQSLAVLGPLSDALSSVVEMHNMNPDTIILTNGTDTPKERELATNRSATWEKQLEAYKVPIINNTIVRIERLRDGKGPCPAPPSVRTEHISADDQQIMVKNPDDYAGPNGKHCDLFRVHFEYGLTLNISAFLVNIPIRQTSHLPKQLGLNITTDQKVMVTPKTITSIEGIFAIGDMNNEGSTNVPHAMFNGKKAGVVIHVQLAKEESLAAISKRSLSVISDIHMEEVTWQKIGDELEHMWEELKAAWAT